MTISYVSFIDIMGANSSRVPAVVDLKLIALYATGSDGIEATAAQKARFQAADVGIILIDQSPSGVVFASGMADVLDIENGAATYAVAVSACKARAARGWLSTLYISQDNRTALQSTLTDENVELSLVRYAIANYSLSLTEAQDLLASDESVAYVQYGSNLTNPDTPVPGTDLTLSQVEADIDVANSGWADSFLPHAKIASSPSELAPHGYRHVLMNESLDDFAAARGTTVVALIKRSIAAYSAQDLIQLSEASLQDVPVYTENP